MDWRTLFDYRLGDLLLFSPDVYEALHQSYLQQYALLQWFFWVLLLVQVIWLVQYRVILQLSLALVWAWLAYQYIYQTLGQVILAAGTLGLVVAVQTFIHLVLTPASSRQQDLQRVERKKSVMLRVGLVVAGLAPWQMIITGQSSLSLSYGMGLVPTSLVTIGFTLLLYRGWCRWLAIPIPLLSTLAILILLIGLY